MSEYEKVLLSREQEQRYQQLTEKQTRSTETLSMQERQELAMLEERYASFIAAGLKTMHRMALEERNAGFSRASLSSGKRNFLPLLQRWKTQLRGIFGSRVPTTQTMVLGLGVVTSLVLVAVTLWDATWSAANASFSSSRFWTPPTRPEDTEISAAPPSSLAPFSMTSTQGTSLASATSLLVGFTALLLTRRTWGVVRMACVVVLATLSLVTLLTAMRHFWKAFPEKFEVRLISIGCLSGAAVASGSHLRSCVGGDRPIGGSVS